MSVLGKIFVYEEDIQNLRHYIGKLEKFGFAAFGTDNLYQFLKYSEQINPDIVIMNLPEDFNADSKTWEQMESSLCQNRCPQIYINADHGFNHKPAFHYYDFNSADISQEQINNILENFTDRKYLN